MTNSERWGSLSPCSLQLSSNSKDAEQITCTEVHLINKITVNKGGKMVFPVGKWCAKTGAVWTIYWWFYWLPDVHNKRLLRVKNWLERQITIACTSRLQSPKSDTAAVARVNTNWVYTELRVQLKIKVSNEWSWYYNTNIPVSLLYDVFNETLQVSWVPVKTWYANISERTKKTC